MRMPVTGVLSSWLALAMNFCRVVSRASWRVMSSTVTSTQGRAEACRGASNGVARTCRLRGLRLRDHSRGAPWQACSRLRRLSGSRKAATAGPPSPRLLEVPSRAWADGLNRRMVRSWSSSTTPVFRWVRICRRIWSSASALVRSSRFSSSRAAQARGSLPAALALVLHRDHRQHLGHDRPVLPDRAPGIAARPSQRSGPGPAPGSHRCPGPPGWRRRPPPGGRPPRGWSCAGSDRAGPWTWARAPGYVNHCPGLAQDPGVTSR